MPIPAGYGQVNLVFTGANAPTGMECTFGINVGTYSADPTSAAVDIGDALGASNLDSLTCDDVNLTTIMVKYGPDATGPSGFFAFSGEGTLGNQLAPNTAVLVQKITALGGRAGRGRLYWPAATEAGTGSDGVLTAGSVAVLQTAFSAFFTALQSTDLEPVLLHGEGSPIVLPTPLTAFTVQSRVATQRRRLRR